MGEQEGAKLPKVLWRRSTNGGVAQLGEHLPCKQGVKSSNLSISTVAMSKALRGLKGAVFKLA